MIGRKKEFREKVLLGSGGQGVVYRAREVALDRQVVLKSQRYTNPDEKREILAQARRLSAFSLNGIPRILSFFCRRGSVWLVMEYVEGIPMSFLQCRKWPTTMRMYVAVRIAEALSTIHQAGWAHGDLKPSNILLTRNGNVALIDMGFARRMDEYVTKGPAGTIAYMAPEVKLNAVHDPRRADIYSFGVLLYEMLYGVLPDEKETAGFLEEPGDDVQQRIIKRCIDVKPQNRFESALSLQLKLAGVLSLTENDMQPRLVETVEPLLRERMHQCCLQSAADVIKKSKGDAYHLVCEALDWNPESLEALAMLQKIRLSFKRPRSALAAAIAVGITIPGIMLFFYLYSRALPTPLLHRVIHTGGKEYLEPVQGQSSTAVPVVVPLRITEDQTRFRALIDVRDIPLGAMLFFDDSLLRYEGSRARFEVIAGDHVLYAKNSSGIIWQQHIEIAPFETLHLRVHTVE